MRSISQINARESRGIFSRNRSGDPAVNSSRNHHCKSFLPVFISQLHNSFKFLVELCFSAFWERFPEDMTS